jgi:transposase
VIDVATLSVIRRWALREQLSIREISRRTGLARYTVKKYLQSGDEQPSSRPSGQAPASSIHSQTNSPPG